uniref:Uncharacterized protein n=1 Tax=Parascaris univalens TaxID=6257 RepID=A0A915BI39_PARUN
MLSSFGILFSDEAAVTAAEAADRNIREICAKNARGVELPSTSQDRIALDDETEETTGGSSAENKDRTSRSLFDLLHSAVANTYNLLTGGYYGTTAESNSEHERTLISDSANITLDDTGRKKCEKKIPHENCHRLEDNKEHSSEALSLQEAKQEEAIQEVFYRIRAMKDNIAEANKILNSTRTFSVDETMDSVFAIYESAVENLKETTKEASSSAALLLNRLHEDGKSDDGKIEKDCKESVRGVIHHYSRNDNERTASQADNPYKETLARLERATTQVKDITNHILDKQQKHELDDDDEAFHEQVRRLHTHSKEVVQKALENVAALQIDVKESILKSAYAHDSSRLANTAEGTSKRADVEEEIEVETASTASSVDEEILPDDEEDEIVEREITESDSDEHFLPRQNLDDGNAEDD